MRAGRTALLAAGLAIGATSHAAEEAEETVAPKPAWEFSVYANAYFLPEVEGEEEQEEDFVLGVATADHGPLHLEARYNYEALDSGSLWAGWNWSTGETVELEVTPMLGIVAGDTDGFAPGIELGVAWGILDYYLEGEVVFDTGESDDSFAYAWSELGVTPLDWLRVGLVGQRTRVYETERDVQRGVLAQVMLGRFTLGAYWFNPGDDDSFPVALVAIEF